MKLFRIIYWFGSITTERYIRAADEADARKKFAEFTDKKIVSVEEVTQ